MPIRHVNSGSGVTEFVQSATYSIGDRMVPAKADAGTNHPVAKRYVWECTAGGQAAAAYPTWSASYTPDSSTVVSGGATFTCRNPGYSSGSTVNWTFATPFFEYGVYAANASGDFIYVASTHSESLAADTTYTFATNVQIISVSTSTNLPIAGALIGAQSTSYAITLNNAFKVYIYGLTFRVGTAATNKDFILSASDGSHYEYELCSFHQSAGNGCFYIGGASASANTYHKFVDCKFKFGAAGQFLRNRSGFQEFIGCSLDSGSVAPTTMFQAYNPGYVVTCEGCDWSKVVGTLVADAGGTGAPCDYIFINCKLGYSVTMMAAPTIVVNKGTITVRAYNCNTGTDAYDEHWHMYHGDAFGETYATSDVYLNDAPTHDGSTKVSWQIVTRASNCSYYTPYVSPWMDVEYSILDTPITPYLEILRPTTTPYQNNQVWAEFSAQKNTSSTQAGYVNGRMTLLGSAANVPASGKATTDWTAPNVPDRWIGKLAPTQSITPVELGYLRARVCVGLAGETLFVDPQIRN